MVPSAGWLPQAPEGDGLGSSRPVGVPLARRLGLWPVRTDEVAHPHVLGHLALAFVGEEAEVFAGDHGFDLSGTDVDCVDSVSV